MQAGESQVQQWAPPISKSFPRQPGLHERVDSGGGNRRSAGPAQLNNTLKRFSVELAQNG
jgi:hypothetical protein